jgi:hypothetical protein
MVRIGDLLDEVNLDKLTGLLWPPTPVPNGTVTEAACSSETAQHAG